MRILITEDDAALAEALQFSLSQAGYAVDWVPNGAAADDVLKDGVFGLLILDLGLPRLDGFEVLRRLKQDTATAAIPVIMLTARKQESDIVSALSSGARDYLVKPFMPEELILRIRNLLPA